MAQTAENVLAEQSRLSSLIRCETAWGSHLPPLARTARHCFEKPGGLEVPSSNLGAPIETWSSPGPDRGLNGQRRTMTEVAISVSVASACAIVFAGGFSMICRAAKN